MVPVTTLIRRCLDRDPRTRLRDIGEARISLSPDSLSGAGPAVEPTAYAAVEAPARGTRLLPWILVALLSAVAAFALWQTLSNPIEVSSPLTLVAPIPDELHFPGYQMGIIAISPDGKSLALALRDDNKRRLYVRRLDSLELVPLPGTEDAKTPFFSPDGQWIGFFADDKMKKVPVSGGTPVTLCDSSGQNRLGRYRDKEINNDGQD